jgi:hypothetical protein
MLRSLLLLLPPDQRQLLYTRAVGETLHKTIVSQWREQAWGLYLVAVLDVPSSEVTHELHR